MNYWWYGKLPIAECLILAGLGRIVFEFVFAANGWPVSRSDFLIPLAIAIFGFVSRARGLRYP
jgi:hypothetical protein